MPLKTDAPSPSDAPCLLVLSCDEPGHHVATALRNALGAQAGVRWLRMHTGAMPDGQLHTPDHVWLNPDAPAEAESTLRQALAGVELLFVAGPPDRVSHPATLTAVLRWAQTLGMVTVASALPPGDGVGSGGEAAPPPAHWAHCDALLTAPAAQWTATLHQTVQQVAAIIHEYGHVNVDVDDVRSVLQSGGRTLLGTGCATGADRAQHAAQQAVASLPDAACTGLDLGHATRVLVLLSAARGSLRLSESRQVMQTLQAQLAPTAQVIFGAAYDDALGAHLHVTVLAAGWPVGAAAITPAHAADMAPTTAHTPCVQA